MDRKWSQIMNFSQANNIRDAKWRKRIQASIFISDTIICQILLGGIGEEEIPDPIPNSEVKLFIADGTAHKSVGE